jgi:hypothetical protein
MSGGVSSGQAAGQQAATVMAGEAAGAHGRGRRRQACRKLQPGGAS